MDIGIYSTGELLLTSRTRGTVASSKARVTQSEECQTFTLDSLTSLLRSRNIWTLRVRAPPWASFPFCGSFSSRRYSSRSDAFFGFSPSTLS